MRITLNLHALCQYLSHTVSLWLLVFISACNSTGDIYQQPSEWNPTTAQIDLEESKPPIKLAKKLKPHSPIQCSDHNDTGYPGQLPSVALSYYEASVRDVFAEIGMLIDFPIIVDEYVDGTVTIETENIRLDKALDLISASSNLSYRFFEDYILVGMNSVDTPSWASLSINCRYWPKYVSAELLFNSLGDVERQFMFYPRGADYLTISAPPGIQKKIQNSLLVFDHSPGQVLLELSIVEITKTDIDRLGIRWHDNNALLSQRIVFDQPDLIRQLQMLAKSGQTEIKAMPSLLSVHGKKAKFSTMQEANQWQPDDRENLNYQNYSNYSQYRNYRNINERETLEYGVNMEIIPYITDSGAVTLKIIEASVSDIVTEGEGFLSLIKHKISNQVTVKNGEFVLLGGMMQQSTIKHSEGLSGLKKLPLLGRLFGQERQRKSDYEIWIMIRPSILED